MNRSDRRKIKKRYGEDGLKAFHVIDRQINRDKYSIPEGTKVMINPATVTRGNSKRNRWVDEHIDEIFSVEHDEKWGENPSIYCLAEDDSGLKWYFTDVELLLVSAQE